MGFAPELGAAYLAVVVAAVHLTAWRTTDHVLVLCAAAPPAAAIVAAPSPNWLVAVAMVLTGAVAVWSELHHRRGTKDDGLHWSLRPQWALFGAALLTAAAVMLAAAASDVPVLSGVAAAGGVVAFGFLHVINAHFEGGAEASGGYFGGGYVAVPLMR